MEAGQPGPEGQAPSPVAAPAAGEGPRGGETAGQLPRRQRRGKAAAAGAGTAAPTGTNGSEAAARLLIGAAALLPVLWMLHRGPLVAPISLFSAADSTSGFFTASHILPLMALVGGLAGLWAILSRRAQAPGLLPTLALALPLLGLWGAAAHATYAHDARYDLQIALALTLLYLAFVAAIGSRSGVTPALFALAAIGVWLAIVALRQFTAGQPTPVAWTGPAFAAAIPLRVAATLHNPNALAAVLLLCIGGASGLAVASRSLLLRVLGLLALLPMAAALPLTFSRAAYLGLALTVLLAAVATPAGRRLRYLACLAAIAVPIGLVAYKVPGVAFRVHGISVGSGGDVSSRFFTWTDTLTVLRTHPRWGAGPGGLQVLYAAAEPPGAKGTYGLIDVPGSADSDPLEWAAQTGVIGTVALAAGLVLLGVPGGRGLARRGPDAQAVGAVLGASILGVALQGVFEVTAYVLPVEALLALSVAILTGAAGLARPVQPAWVGRILGAAVAVAAVALAGRLHAPWPAQQTFARGWAMVQSGSAAAARPLLEAAFAADPTSARDAAAAGDASVRVAYAAGKAQPPAAVVSAARTDLAAALRLNPFDGDTWAAAAALLRVGGPTPGAACAQQAAVRSFPNSPYFAAQFGADLTAQGLAAGGRSDAAYAAGRFALELAVYREHGNQGAPYYAAAQKAMEAGRQAWGAAPLPQRPVLPLSTDSCVADIQAAGLPGWTFSRAMRGH